MVQSVGSLADSYTLFQLGGAARTAAGGSAGGIASFAATPQSGTSAGAATNAIASILDNGQVQATSGDFASAFQRLSSGLQALMVQLQSTVSPSATATPALGGVAATASSEVAPVREPGFAPLHRPSAGNRALQGDIDALVNDLRGLVQVGNGDASSADDGGKVASSANDNADPAASRLAADGTPPAAGPAATASPPEMAAAGALDNSIDSFAQNLLQALQNYSVANAPVANPQRSIAVDNIS
jgi:hypothetical protein